MSRSHYYQPMLAKVAEKAFTDENWIFEIKWDGFRAIAYLEQPFSIRSRRGKELKNNFPELSELTRLGSNLVVDGEIVVMRQGKPDFQTLLERGQAVSEGEIRRHAQRAPAVYVVFDILEKNGGSLTALPLLERKKLLRESLKEGAYVLLSDFIEEKGEAYYQIVLKRGLEGIMAKRKASAYEENMRTGDWLKIKMLKTCDCVIFGYTRGNQSREDSFGALLLGLYDRSGNPVYVGKVGSGFSQNTLRMLMDKFDKIKTEDTPFEPDVGDVVTWLEPRLVCEVMYQVVTHDGKLRMPRFQRLRQDKSPAECMIDQLLEEKNLDKKQPTLSEYQSKRNFRQTPEPSGGNKKDDGLIFVVQEHNARRLHYDLRLEHDGVLKSWAVPKGIPEFTKVRHLAVETEDHPYDYASFEGEIPKGQYGAGTVKIWDYGHYIPTLWEHDKIEVTLEGEKLHGRYVLVRLKKSEDQKDWLLLKGKDDSA